MEEGFNGFAKRGLAVFFPALVRFTCPLDEPPFENGPAKSNCPEMIQKTANWAASKDAGDDLNRNLSCSLFRNFIVLDLLNLRQGILTTNFGENQSKESGLLKYNLAALPHSA